jgi:hypothetical protein
VRRSTAKTTQVSRIVVGSLPLLPQHLTIAQGCLDIAQWSLRVHRELSRWKHMGNEYTPSSDEMKHLIMPSRRDMDFLHSHNNEGYMHSNVIDLEKFVKDLEESWDRDDPTAQSTDGMRPSNDNEEKFIAEEEASILVAADKEWELICGEKTCDWEILYLDWSACPLHIYYGADELEVE